MPTTRTADLCYVFCAVEGTPLALPAAGMPAGGPPRAVPLHDSVTLIVATVPSDTYGSDKLEPRLADLEWVSAAGAAHHAVVDALADAGMVVLPFRLFSLFSSEDKARATLNASRVRLTHAFDRVRGKQEWMLRIGKPDPARRATVSEAAAPRAGAVTSGTNFLQAKAEAKREASARATRVREDAAAAYEALEQLADAAKSKPVDANGNLIIDAAFLVPPSRIEAMKETLTRRAERLLRDGCAVSLTGPWPPYSFASIAAESND